MRPFSRLPRISLPVLNELALAAIKLCREKRNGTADQNTCFHHATIITISKG